MTIDLTEVKAYLEANFTFEDERDLEETAKRMKAALENSLFGMTKIESFKKDIEKVVDSSSRGNKVKDYSLRVSGNKDKREFHLQGHIELE